METYKVERMRGADGTWSVFVNEELAESRMTEREAADYVARWQPPQVYPIPVEPACDMAEDCREPVSMIDQKGYAYCTDHGMERRFYQPCRKLRPWELRRLQSGRPLNRY